MDGVRAKITPTLNVKGLIHLKIDWISVEADLPGEVRFSEEFALSPERPGCSYVSRVCVGEATVLPGTFWLDEEGRRHFRLDAEVALLGLAGGVIDTDHALNHSPENEPCPS